MQTYRLVFGNPGPVETLEFEAASLAAALRVADREIGDRPADLWEDGNRLGRIRKARSASAVFWQVLGSGTPALRPPPRTGVAADRRRTPVRT